MSFKPGDWVRWADAKRDQPDAPIRGKEMFVIRSVSANGRCDLMDERGAELFDIPLSDLQLLEGKFLPKKPPTKGKARRYA